ncbi:MAG: class I SAM-dependent methyltransferase [Armatimonadetes bacterium]|nr:class I SAM-dependent methyltransferase [Armatimonadota bacterium]
MLREFRTQDWDSYRMDFRNPHQEIEPIEREMAVVDAALAVLHEAGILPHTRYDHGKLLALRQAVRENFEIPWTAITPRMQRLIYAINAIHQPRVMIAAGIFCGNTFICNAGAAVGPGACYRAERLIGVEIQPAEAERAQQNVRRLDPEGHAEVIAGDAVDVVTAFDGQIDLLYLDADGGPGGGKSIYLQILLAAYDKLAPGALVLAHNSVNAGPTIAPYLDFVRDPWRMSASVNIVIDPEGLEVSMR